MNKQGGIGAYIFWVGIGFILGAIFATRFLC